MVPGRAAAALGARLLLARATASRPGTTPRSSPTSAHPTAHGAADAERFLARARRTARRRPTGTCRPATRTSGTTSGASGGCRSNVDPFDARLDDELERDRLRRVFTQGLDAVVGYALPLGAVGGRRRTLAHRAVVPARRAAVPDARRLADGLPPAARLAAVGRPRRPPHDRTSSIRSRRVAPLAAAARSGDAQPRCQARQCTVSATPARQSRVGGARGAQAPAARSRVRRRAASRPRGIVRTALCVEPRDGVLYVFMPPLADARGLPRARRGRRSHGRGARHAACCSKATRRRAIRGCAHFHDHARPRRDRGEHPAGARLGRARRADDDAVRGGAPVAA